MKYVSVSGKLLTLGIRTYVSTYIQVYMDGARGTKRANLLQDTGIYVHMCFYFFFNP